MKKVLLTIILSGIAYMPCFALYEAEVQSVVEKYLPEHYGFARPKVTKINVNDKKKTIIVDVSESGTYIPLTPESLSLLKADILNAIPKTYQDYKVQINAAGKSFDSLALFADRKIVAPKENDRFVTRPQASYPMGMDGSNIALWQSHGLYYQGHDTWGWQRPRLWQTCEDLFTQSFVIPFLMPMLENAGAYVMSPRERDVNLAEYIIDNDDASAAYAETVGEMQWEATQNPGFAYDFSFLTDYQNPFTQGTARVAKTVKDKDDESKATWNAEISDDGNYAIYVSYQSLPNSATDAVYTVNSAGNSHEIVINQKMGGGTWIYLGHFPLKAGLSDKPIVELSNVSSKHGAVVTADAVKIGGGMGNVARRPTSPDPDGIEYDYMVSGYPRFTEGARYWLQWAGAPDSVYSATEYTIEYNDDYRSRGLWVNWLTGGSSVLPDANGLKIPVDLSFAFHSDAGITPGDSIIGTLGIYCTDEKEAYPNGTSRLAARDFTDLVLTNITNDVRASFEPQWTRRGMWDRSYAEARVPQVPAMLLELLSHQNFADMRYGLDPAFRFVVSRAIYKAMLQFLAHRDGRQYVVQPLPVRAFAIKNDGDGSYTLSWAECVDSLETTASPTYYIIEHRGQDDLEFAPIAEVAAPLTSVEVIVSDSDIHSYRIIAANAGGVSFPSEVLALRYVPDAEDIMIVNGFTQVSAPDWIDTEAIDGFVNEGIPYIQDIAMVGRQFEFRRDIPWMSNEVSGLGGSRSDLEARIIAGNTFDFVALHGEAIAAAGYGFVSSSVEAFVADDSTPAVVDLILGNQHEVQVGSGRYGTRFKAFDAPLQDRLRKFTAAGGNVFVSGAYIGSDIWNNPYSTESVKDADIKFAKDVLGFVWRAGDATDIGYIETVKNRYNMFDHLGSFSFNDDLNSRIYAVSSPSAIAPSDSKGAVVMRYTSGLLPAATAFDGKGYRTVAIGVPFETIESPARISIMKSILDFLYR